jgi:negative regulator of sigma E activity
VIGSLAPNRRGPVPLTALAVPVLAVQVFVGSVALSAPASALEAGDELSAVRLLHRAMAAPEAVSYSGTQYVAAWSTLDGDESTSAIVDVIHRAGRSTQVLVHGAQTLSAVNEHSSAGWLAGGGGPVGLLVRTHDVAVVGAGSVAGRSAHVVEARRANGTTAARLWLDAESGLPLRREVYGEDGTTRTASAFIEFTLERAPRASSANTSALTTDTALRRSDLALLRGDGWNCPDRLDGGLVLYEARRVDDAVQLSYSDGVVTVSVFEQRGHLDEEKLQGYSAREVDGGVVYSSTGPPAQLTWSVGDWVVTVVSDAPSETIDAVLAAMPPRAPDYERGFFARIGKGAERVASWLNPFE